MNLEEKYNVHYIDGFKEATVEFLGEIPPSEKKSRLDLFKTGESQSLSGFAFVHRSKTYLIAHAAFEGKDLDLLVAPTEFYFNTLFAMRLTEKELEDAKTLHQTKSSL